VVCLTALALPAAAQDERQVASPNGAWEFRLFVAQPAEGRLFRLAYQVRLRGKLLLDTSYLGLNIHDQEPVLGENVGLTASRVLHPDTRHNSLVAEYMQNGSIGRRINVEVGVWDDGVAFRYVIPLSTPLEEILVEDEETEFSFAQPSGNLPAGPVPLPFVIGQPGAGAVGVYESGAPGYPRTNLIRSDPTTMITRLAARVSTPPVAYEGATPLECPWRIVIAAPDAGKLLQTQIARDLLR
jgi:alpha-glucosidase